MKKIQILSLVVVCLASGCATKPEIFTDKFTPANFVAKPVPPYEGLPHGGVFPVSGIDAFKKFIEKDQYEMPEWKNYIYLGYYGSQSNSALTPELARKITSACGGDKYIAVTAITQSGFYNTVNVFASVGRARELLSSGVLVPPQTLPPAKSKMPRSQTRKPSSNADLLLNNSTL
jgi:hypothetical protein